MSRRGPLAVRYTRAPLTPEDAERALHLLSVAMDSAGQARLLLAGNDLAVDVLDEVSRLLDLTQVHATAEVELAQEAS